jgi:hypothetical protein
MITLIPRALLAICLLTGHLWYPHDGGPEVQQMSDQFPCFRCGAAIDRAFPVSDNPFGTLCFGIRSNARSAGRGIGLPEAKSVRI